MQKSSGTSLYLRKDSKFFHFLHVFSSASFCRDKIHMDIDLASVRRPGFEYIVVLSS